MVDASIFVAVTYYFIIMALQCSLLSRNVMPPALFFFLRIAFSLQDLLWFNTNFKIVSSISMNNAFSILIGIALTL